MKLLTYCFFKPLSLPEHRSWDKDKGEPNRYYYNVPAAILTNKILYPEYRTRIYFTSNILENPLSEIFNVLEDENVDFFEFDSDYSLTEPTIARMCPLWEDVEIFHTRDIDSVPTSVEYRYAKLFERSSFGIGTIRTHENHYGRACRMLAGLSSFKPGLIPQEIKGPSFQDYFSKNHGRYGCDQDLMIQYFTTNPEYTSENFYDCAAYRQFHDQDFPCVKCDSCDLLSVDINEEARKLFDLQKTEKLDDWAGEPVDSRGAYTNHLLRKFPKIKNKMNQSLKDFYHVD
jgi:hypothetical protein